MRKKRWIKRIAGIVAVLVAAGVLLWFLPSGNMVVAPGITRNLAEMVQVKHPKSQGPGKLLMVAVTMGSANELLSLMAHVDPALELIPKQQATGGLSIQQYEQYNVKLMDQSQMAAEVAGEHLAGLNARQIVVPGALIAGIMKGPAQGKLKLGDLLVKVGPYPVKSYTEVRSILQKHYKVGEIVNLTVQRNRQSVLVPVKTEHLKGDAAPAIGVLIAPKVRYQIPQPVQIKSGNIGGPSAGMMFALEIYRQITGANLAKGRTVAGTGEITPDGKVLPIGGISQKVITVHRAGARVFLCPTQNFAQAEKTAKQFGYTNMKIYAVANLQQALNDLTRG